MPELPEVECLTRAVRSVLEGRTLSHATFHRSDLRWPVPTADFTQRLVGVPIRSVSRRSKYLLLESDRGYGIFHLGMSGNILLSEHEQSTWKHTHASLRVDGENGSRFLHFVDPRRFGCILSCSPEDFKIHPLLKDLGPEPLDCPDLASHLAMRAQGKTVPVKNFLMDAHQVVGVGNIYANEALFRAGVRPDRKVALVREASWVALASAIQDVLSEAIEAGGTSFRDYKHVDGEPGYFELALRVYGRAGETCVGCGGKIKLAKLGGRATYFCSRCQR